MNDEQTLAFENDEDILTSNNVIAYYQPGAPLQLFTDASLKHGLGFYLKSANAKSGKIVQKIPCSWHKRASGF